MWRVEVLRGWRGGGGVQRRDEGVTPTVSPHATRRAAEMENWKTLCDARAMPSRKRRRDEAGQSSDGSLPLTETDTTCSD